MTDYSDVPQAHILWEERETVVRAMDMLDNDGWLASLTVNPAPGAPGMAATTTMQPPTPPNVVAMITNVLRDRLRDIDAQLADLGVTDTPPMADTKPRIAPR
jgi:hypothetical protein